MKFDKLFRTGHQKTILALDVNRDGILSSISEDGHCILWSSDGQIAQDLDLSNEHCTLCHLHPLNSIVFDSSNSNTFYISCGKIILVYDIRKCSKSQRKYEFNTDEINQLCVNHSGRYLAACDDAGEVKVIDVQESCLFKTLSRHHHNICSTVQFRPKKSWQLLSAGLDCNIINWDFSCGKPQQIFDINYDIHKKTSNETLPFINPPFVHSISLSEDGKKFAAGLGNGDIGLFQFHGKKFKIITSLKAHDTEVSQIFFHKFKNFEEQSLVSGGNDGRLKIWKEITDGQSSNYKLCYTIVHGSKVNWITCSSFVKDSIFVADQSFHVAEYRLEL